MLSDFSGNLGATALIWVNRLRKNQITEYI